MTDSKKEASAENKTLSDVEVTSHTASLWKYNPIPESPEPYPEYLTAYDKKDSSEIIAARVRGKKHKHEGSNCDDWYAFDRAGEWTIAVVSDGAGSKALSRIGAKASCDAVAASLKTEFTAVTEMCPDIKKDLSKAYDDPAFNASCAKLAVLMQNSFKAAFSAVENAYIARAGKPEFEESMGRKPEISDYSGTLLAAVVIPVEKGEHFIIAVQIGDGMICSVNFDADFDNALRILGNPDGGAFAGETEFLTSEQTRGEDSLKSRTRILRGKVSSVMLMSDGVADDYYPNNPQLLRMYLDLMTNGITDLCEDKNGKCSLKAPEPVSYPWVNDGDVSYALQYTKNILAENNIELSQLWKERKSGIIGKASLKSFDISNGNAKADRLMVWLDNYVERGSFDDRTLVIINV